MTGVNFNQAATPVQLQSRSTVTDRKALLLELGGSFFSDPAKLDRFTLYLDCAGIDCSRITRELEDFFLEYRVCLCPRTSDLNRLFGFYNRPARGTATLLSRAIEINAFSIVREATSLPSDIPDSHIGWLLGQFRKIGKSTNDSKVLVEFFDAYCAGLKAQQSQFDAVGGSGMTALMGAAVRGDCFLLKWLLDRNADPHLMTADNRSALCLAMHQGHADACELLLTKGANFSWLGICAAIQRGKLDIIKLIKAHQPEFAKHSPFIGQALNVPAEVRLEMMELLKSAGASPDWPCTPEGYLPIQLCALRSDVLSASMLLQIGAKVDAPGGHGDSPLRGAFVNQNSELASLLFRNGASTASFSPAEMPLLMQLIRLDNA